MIYCTDDFNINSCDDDGQFKWKAEEEEIWILNHFISVDVNNIH